MTEPTNNIYEEWDEGTLAFWAQGLGMDPRVHLREMGDEQLDAFRQDIEAQLVFITHVQEERQIERANNVVKGDFDGNS